MKTLIIYESVFGNTKQVAEAIGEALGEDVLLLKPEEITAEHLEGLELLFIGSPTRAFTATEGVKKYLRSLGASSLSGVRVAAFDTRIDPSDVHNKFLPFLMKTFGYAAGTISKLAAKKGATQAASPEGFFVQDSEGPLKENEAKRAHEWASGLMQK